MLRAIHDWSVLVVVHPIHFTSFAMEVRHMYWYVSLSRKWPNGFRLWWLGVFEVFLGGQELNIMQAP